jgi:tetratricopeptide (TPR) repeat protein
VAKRYTRKQLRQPDEFVSFWTRVYEFLRASAGPILIGVGVGLVAVIVSVALTSHMQRVSAEASRQLSRIMRMYATDLATDDDAAKKAQPDDDVPRFKTADERRKATLSELDSYLTQNRTKGPVREAELFRAGVLYDAGQYDEAVRAYGEFLAESGNDQRLRFLAREGRGYSYEAKGKFDDALGEFGKLEGETDLYKDRAQYHQARILEKKGDVAGAQKLLKAILDKNPTSTLRDDISNRLAALEAR